MTREPRRARIGDVAALARVDRAVVSKVINGAPGLSIRPDTRERVWNAIKALDYRPNVAARSLRTARAGAFGLLIPDFTNPIYASIIAGAQLAATQRDHLVLTASASSPEGLARAVGLLGGGRVDGLLLAGGAAPGDARAQIDALGVPWVLLNRTTRSATRSIVLDDAGATRLAVEHLVSLGHRAIAHIAGLQGADTAARRLKGFRATMADAGLPVRRGFVVAADYTNRGGFDAMSRLARATPRPTAVVIANVASAIGALRAAHLAGVRVPGQLSIVSVHDLPLVEYLEPPLTTVDMPVTELGRRGIEVLSTLPPNADVREVIRQPMRLVARDSTAPPP